MCSCSPYTSLNTGIFLHAYPSHVRADLFSRKMVFGAVARSAGISRAACVEILAHRALEGLENEVGI